MSKKQPSLDESLVCISVSSDAVDRRDTPKRLTGSVCEYHQPFEPWALKLGKPYCLMDWHLKLLMRIH